MMPYTSRATRPSTSTASSTAIHPLSPVFRLGTPTAGPVPGAADGRLCWQAGGMTDFTREDLRGARFEDVYLTDARFHDVDLTHARFRLVDLTGVSIRGAVLMDVDISGQVENLRVNGVDVAPLVEAELDRRYPDRVKM